MRPIIDNNRLFLAMPPLFKIQHKEKIFYAYDENEKDKIIKSEFKKIIPTLSRYKGLGEMPADQLKSTTMNPEKRKLLNVNIKQALMIGLAFGLVTTMILGTLAFILGYIQSDFKLTWITF